MPEAALTRLARLQAAVRLMAASIDRGEFVPLLEADIDGYLLHILLEQSAYPLAQMHQNARVLGLTSRRYDLVIGSVDLHPAGGGRAGTSDPQLVVQGKFYPQWGFTPQQQNVHLDHVLEDDIPALAEVARPWPTAHTCSLQVDLHRSPGLMGYLSGVRGKYRRIDLIRERCHDVGASVIWLHPAQGGCAAVELFEPPPA